MNSVAFGIFIGLATIIVMFLIQKVIDNPNS
jgi:hypothetical protein